MFTGMKPDLAKVQQKESVEEENEEPGYSSPIPPTQPPDTKTDSSSAGIHPNLLQLSTESSVLAMHTPRPLFLAEQLGIDRRLLVNRKRQLKMYRVWMQAKFLKMSAPEVL
jgi:tRNAThr (cytosine32-N3)-methyltransferase